MSRITCSWCHELNAVRLSPTFCRCGHRADLPRMQCDCKKCRFKILAWPNRLGHDVYENGLFIGEVCDDPEQPGVGVHIPEEHGNPEKRWHLPEKIDPIDAVLRCRAEGKPSEED